MTGLEILVLTCLAGDPADCTVHSAIDVEIVDVQTMTCPFTAKLAQEKVSTDPRFKAAYIPVQVKVLCDIKRTWTRSDVRYDTVVGPGQVQYRREDEQ